MQKKVFIILLLSLTLLGCNAKKTAKAEKAKTSMTQEVYMEAKRKEFIKENAYLQGFYTKGDGELSEIRFEGDKIYYIEYAFKNNSYIEEETHEAYLKFDFETNSFRDAVYDGKALRGIRLPPDKPKYATFAEAVAANNRWNYNKSLKIKSVKATSTLKDADSAKYSAENLVDGTYKSWVEGEDGSGIGTKIEFEFEHPYYFLDATNYACIYIANGFGDLRYFRYNNRVKDMNIWIDDAPEPVKVTLLDYRLPQTIVLRNKLGNKIARKITFEILSVYPGTKYDDTCISEIHIGPAEVNQSSMIVDSYQAELTYAYYRDIIKDTSHYRFNKGNLEYYDNVGRDPTMIWQPLYTLTARFGQIDFDFYGDTPIIVKPGAVQNQKEIDENIRFDELGADSCLALYKDYKLYAYKNSSWTEENNSAIMQEIEKVFSEHKDQYFTFDAENSWGNLNTKDQSYSTAYSRNYIEVSFFKDKVVIFREQKKNSLPEYDGTYKFRYDGTKYVLAD